MDKYIVKRPFIMPGSGRTCQKGEVLDLAPRQARYLVLDGKIEAYNPDPPAPKRKRRARKKPTPKAPKE